MFEKPHYIHHRSNYSKINAEKNHQQYLDTVKRYKIEFGYWPPKSIWPHQEDKKKIKKI